MKRILDFLNLLSDDGKLSITNIAVIALITKMCLSPNLDWPSITAMVITFANYMHKRKTVSDQEEAENAKKVAELQNQVTAAITAQASAIADLNKRIGGLSQLGELLKMKPK